MEYLRALTNYFHTEKGKYDAGDFLRAMLIISAVMAAVWGLAKLIVE